MVYVEYILFYQITGLIDNVTDLSLIIFRKIRFGFNYFYLSTMERPITG